jgi:hypothetical protein
MLFSSLIIFASHNNAAELLAGLRFGKDEQKKRQGLI